MVKINFKLNDDLLKKQLKPIHAFDLSLLFLDYDEDEKVRVLSNIEQEKLIDLFILLNLDEQIELLNLLSVNQKKSLLRNLESDDLKEFISDLNEEGQQEVFGLLSQVKAKMVRLLMEYEEDSAASIMSTDFVKINLNMTIKEATNVITTESRDQDYLDSLYVVDDKRKLVGVIDLKDLIIARHNQSLESIMSDDFQFVYEEDSIESAIQTVKDYDRNAIPVLNYNHEILGIVTADDIFDELIEDIEFDYKRMALLDNHESSSSAFTRTKQRLPWLMVAVVLNLMIASFLSIFEATITEVVALVLFQPLILGMAGNIGTQSLAVTILGFHHGKFDKEKTPRAHIFKEMIIGLINGILLALATFVLVFAFLNIFPTGSQNPMSLALVVMITTFFSLFVSAVMGALIPIILNRYGADPTTASGPIMTTINDIVSLVIYFGIATIIFL